MISKAIEQVLLNGRSRSYSLELLLRKNKGRFKGWTAYTLSKSEQQTPGRTANEHQQWRLVQYPIWQNPRHFYNLELWAQRKMEIECQFLISNRATYLPQWAYTHGWWFHLRGTKFQSITSLPRQMFRPYTANPTKIWVVRMGFSVYNLYNRQKYHSLWTLDKTSIRAKWSP